MKTETIYELAHCTSHKEVFSCYTNKVNNQTVSNTANQMAFKTDGSSHHNGVTNETNTIEILNEKKIYPAIVEKRGGTKLKEDAVAGCKKISIKRKADITQGSFDWLNTTTHTHMFGDSFNEFLGKIKSFRELSSNITSDKEFVEMVRDAFNQVCESALNNLTAEQLTEIIQTGMVEPLKGFDVIVNDIQTKDIYKFNADDHPVVKYLSEGYVPTLTKVREDATTSRKVVFIKNGQQRDCGFRIRVTSNNGINAFLGNSRANKNSRIVIKLQQDNLPQLLEMVNSDQIKY